MRSWGTRRKRTPSLRIVSSPSIHSSSTPSATAGSALAGSTEFSFMWRSMQYHFPTPIGTGFRTG